MITSSKDRKNNTDRASIRLLIAQSISNVLTDPDFGRDLTPSFLRKLKISMQDKKVGRTTDLKSFLRDLRK